MATETIYIKKQENTDGLHFTDSEGHTGDNTITTKVKSGDTVIWKIVPDSGIDEIKGIEETGGVNLFENPPKRDTSDPTSWIAQIKENASGTETYTIKYSIDNVEHIFESGANGTDKKVPNNPDLEMDPDEK